MSTRDHRLQIAVEGERIAATLIAPATAVPGVLFVHGWGGSQQQYLARAREIAALGCIGLTFDLRGHAKTDAQQETVSYSGCVAAWPLRSKVRQTQPSAAISCARTRYCSWQPPQP